MRNQTYQLFNAGDVTLASGEQLANTQLAYVTHGKLNDNRDNAILVTTFFGGTHENSQYLIGENMAIDPDRYFVVVANLLGNGLSSSPSHGLGHLFPKVTMHDNARLQYRFLRETFGIEQLALATGHSMGAVCTFHLAALFPEFVARAAPFCGASKISTHNHVFLEGMRGILTADPKYLDGKYTEAPVQGLVTMARAWAAWPPSPNFYRYEYYKILGYKSVDEYLSQYWETFYGAMDANNILAQIDNWQSADISANDLYQHDFDRALASITAKTFVMPSVSDAYFPPEDNAYEVSKMTNAELRPIESLWGHWAGSNRNPADTAFLDAQIRELLAS